MTKKDIINHIKSTELPEAFISILNNESIDKNVEYFWHEPKFFFDSIKSDLSTKDIISLKGNFKEYDLFPIFEIGYDSAGTVILSLKSSTDHKFIEYYYQDKANYVVHDNLQNLLASLVINLHEEYDGQINFSGLSNKLGFKFYDDYVKNIEPLFVMEGVQYDEIKIMIQSFIKNLKDETLPASTLSFYSHEVSVQNRQI